MHSKAKACGQSFVSVPMCDAGMMDYTPARGNPVAVARTPGGGVRQLTTADFQLPKLALMPCGRNRYLYEIADQVRVVTSAFHKMTFVLVFDS